MTVVTDTLAFKSYAFYSAILLFKLIAMVPMTAMNRFRKNAFANPEDLPSKKMKVTLDDPDVERVRRAHLNDLENILPFFGIAFLYCCTNPNPDTANILFKAFAFSRILHTIVYAVYPIKQPARFLAFAVGYGVNIYMSFAVLSHYA